MSSARVNIIVPDVGKPHISMGFSQSTHNFPSGNQQFILLPPLIALMVLRSFNGPSAAHISEKADFYLTRLAEFLYDDVRKKIM